MNHAGWKQVLLFLATARVPATKTSPADFRRGLGEGGGAVPLKVASPNDPSPNPLP
jgi:hypothetical protein